MRNISNNFEGKRLEVGGGRWELGGGREVRGR